MGILLGVAYLHEVVVGSKRCLEQVQRLFGHNEFCRLGRCVVAAAVAYKLVRVRGHKSESVGSELKEDATHHGPKIVVPRSEKSFCNRGIEHMSGKFHRYRGLNFRRFGVFRSVDVGNRILARIAADLKAVRARIEGKGQGLLGEALDRVQEHTGRNGGRSIGFRRHFEGGRHGGLQV